MDLSEGNESATVKKFFVVRSNSSTNEDEFRKRQSSIFDVLNDLEVKHGNEMATLLPYHDDVEDDEEGTTETMQFTQELKEPCTKLPHSSTKSTSLDTVDEQCSTCKPEEEIESFKVPIGVAPKRRSESSTSPQTTQSIPSYLTHPQKWTKYTLTEVGNEQMSENANANAALEFLSSRQNMKWVDDCGKEAPNENSTEEACVEDEEKISFTSNEQFNFTKGIVRKRADSEKAEPVSTSRLSFLNREDEQTCEGSGSQLAHDEHNSCRPIITSDNEQDASRLASVPKGLFRVVHKKKRNIRRKTSELETVDNNID